MKFLCPNCKAKYRIGPEKMVGRQAAKIRCRKCEFLIQIAFRGNSDEFDVTATPPSVAPPPPAHGTAQRPPKTTAGQPVMAPVPLPSAAPRPRAAASLPLGIQDEGSASKKPTAAVPGLPGLGSAKSTRGAALLSDPGLARRPLAPLPPPPIPPLVGASSSAGLAPLASTTAAAAVHPPASPPPPSPPPASPPPPSPAPPLRMGASSTPLADQFRESIQAGGAPEELPQEGWFVGVNGVPLGPIPLGDLRELAAAGHIDRRSLVWRDGQPEWRPLGKFPGLARLIEDGAAPPATPQERVAPAPAPEASRPNGAVNGQHVATGFDVVRTETSGPSAWGDLDDEDDEDEQPTTVKGRVSVFPTASVPPPPPPPVQPSSAPAASPPIPTPAPPAVNPFGVTSAPIPVPSGGQGSALASAAATATNPFGIPPEPSLEADVGMIRSSGRNRWYLIIAAIVVAFTLGGIIASYLMRTPSTAEKPSKKASNGESWVPAPEPASLERSTRSARTDTPPILVDRAGDSLPDYDVPSADEPRPTITTAIAPLKSIASAMSARLAREGGAGLDAKTIQRTVRRYSAGVRQNCWLRSREARPSGVPTSAKVSATITVDPSGRVRAVSVAGAPKSHPGLARCIEGDVRSWHFPRSSAQTITSVPFVFLGR